MSESANYNCPRCNGRLTPDEAAAKRFHCLDCGEAIHEAVAEAAEDLKLLADRDDRVGDMARTLLDTGGVKAENGGGGW